MNRIPVKNRIVFYVGGYDPQSAPVFFDHLDRQISRFETLWKVKIEKSEIESLSPHIKRRIFTAKPEKPEPEKPEKERQWQTRTEFHFLETDDIVKGDYESPFLPRLARYLRAAADYVFSGTAFLFLEHAWRYFVYFLYPIKIFFITLFLAALAGWAVPYFSGASRLLAPLVFLAVFYAVKRLFWDRYWVMTAMETWTFTRAFLRRERKDIDRRIGELAQCIERRVANAEDAKGDMDEIIFIGHSMGGALIMDAAYRARDSLAAVSDECHRGFLTVGSTVLKAALHPEMRWFTKRLSALFADRRMRWVEYQCHSDLISFYKTDPAALMNLDLSADCDGLARPIVHQIRFKRMMNPDSYRRLGARLFRLHYQFVYGNERKYHYDFPAICFGPARLVERAMDKTRFSEHLLAAPATATADAPAPATATADAPEDAIASASETVPESGENPAQAKESDYG